MNIQRNFWGQTIILFESEDTGMLIDMLIAIEPRTEEESELIQRVLLDAIEDDKKRMSS